MKTQFRQQVSEYDCVPTTFVNALSYLFERHEIPPIVVQRMYLYCFDSLSARQNIGHGTSGLAVQLLGQWLGSYRHKGFRLEAAYYSGAAVHLRQGNPISRCLTAGGVGLLCVTHQGGTFHYILAISLSDGWLQCYDPYQRTSRSNRPNCYEYIQGGEPHSPNLRIACSWLNTKSNKGQFHLGSITERECLLLQRDKA